MGEIGEAFEDAEQLLVPETSPDLHIRGTNIGAAVPRRFCTRHALERRILQPSAEHSEDKRFLPLTSQVVHTEKSLSSVALLAVSQLYTMRSNRSSSSFSL
jgi:hypothetical protein